MKTLWCKNIYLFLFVNSLLCINNLSIASNIVDPKFGIKLDISDADCNYTQSLDDSAEKRVRISSKNNAFEFTIFAFRGKLDHEITDKYDSLMLKNDYKKPVSSISIEEFGMKGIRNVYNYRYFNKKKSKYTPEYISYDILYKHYVGEEEYVYVIYTYSNTLNNPLEGDLREKLIINPPKVSFWQTFVGGITTIILYLSIAIGLLLFGKLVIRRLFFNVKNWKKFRFELTTRKISKSNYLELEFAKNYPGLNHEELNKIIEGNFRQVVFRNYKRDLILLCLSVLGIVILNMIIIKNISTDISDSKLYFHVGLETALIIMGIFNKLDWFLEILGEIF